MGTCILLGTRVYILNHNTNQTFPPTILQVTLDHGAPAPMISCISSRSTQTDLTWTKDTVNGILPSGVAQSYEFLPNRQHQRLVWTRNLLYSDTGRYSCTSSTRHEIDARPEMDLTVRSESIKACKNWTITTGGFCLWNYQFETLGFWHCDVFL